MQMTVAVDVKTPVGSAQYITYIHSVHDVHTFNT